MEASASLATSAPQKHWQDQTFRTETLQELQNVYIVDIDFSGSVTSVISG